MVVVVVVVVDVVVVDVVDVDVVVGAAVARGRGAALRRVPSSRPWKTSADADTTTMAATMQRRSPTPAVPPNRPTQSRIGTAEARA